MNIEKVTIASIYAVDMYPYIKLIKVKIAMRYFTKGLTTETKKTIKICLEIISFGMRSTLKYFYVEYYKHHGGEKR